MLLPRHHPPGQESAAQASRFEAEAEKKARDLERKKAKPPEIEIEEEKKAPVAEGPSFVLKEVRITGTTIFKQEDLLSAYEEYLNKKVTFKDLEKVIDNIKARYKEKGYLTTTAFLPEQDIRDGKIEIKVVEGKMGKLLIEGTRWFPSDIIRRYFHVKKMSFCSLKYYRKTF